ncbi:MAG: hypothetical protein MJK04_29035, partial [Psychrosphaera sp.]|nr:hypothetical protein [Psychrosphaera sp.]
MNIILFRPVVLVFTAALLSACGGGGGQTTPVPMDPVPTTPPPITHTNQAPIAEAGADLVVNENSEVALSGSGSDTDGSIANYQWARTSGTTVTLSDKATAN